MMRQTFATVAHLWAQTSERLRESLRRLGFFRRPDAPYEVTRRRLVLSNLAVVSAILLVMAVAVFAAESYVLQQQIDDQLRSRAVTDNATDAAALVLRQQTGPVITIPEPGEDTEHLEQYEASSPNVFTLVLDRNGALISDPSGVSKLGLPDNASARDVLNGASTSSLVTKKLDGQSFRLYTTPLTHEGKVIGVLQVGTSLAYMQEQLFHLTQTLLLVGAGMLALTAAASLYLADRALHPMRLAYDRQRQFTAAASHELRTPLAFVRSQLELVSRRLQRAEAQGELVASTQEDINDTLNEVDYMTRLVRDLLLMARDQTDQRSISWEPVDVSEVAREVLDTVQPSAQKGDLRLESSGASEPVWVEGDRDRLRQLLLILLENAIHYTPAGGRVWIETRVTRGPLLAGRRPLAQIIVGDTGIGIAPEHQERIFEAFYRAEGHSAGGNHSGAGLGLAMAHWLVTAHGGDITVRSAPDAGSAFTVSLPAHPARHPHTMEGDGEGATAIQDESSALV